MLLLLQWKQQQQLSDAALGAPGREAVQQQQQPQLRQQGIDTET